MYTNHKIGQNQPRSALPHDHTRNKTRRRVVKNLYGGTVWQGQETKFMFLLIFFTLPTTSMLIAKAFACIEFDNGGGGTDKYMLEDMTLSCGGKQYRAVRAFAIIMGVVFPIGMSPSRAFFTPLFSIALDLSICLPCSVEMPFLLSSASFA